MALQIELKPCAVFVKIVKGNKILKQKFSFWGTDFEYNSACLA